MSRPSNREISHFPPDIWIRRMNQEHPNLWTELRKTHANPAGIIRADTDGIKILKNVPDWCIMPTMFPFFLFTSRYGNAYYLRHMDELMTMASMYIWRCSKGVYRFAPEIYDALVKQPLTGDIPTDCLYRLPEWAVYIETPGLVFERRKMKGFIAHLDYNLFSRNVDLQFALFLEENDQPKMVAIPFGEGGVQEAMDRVDECDDMFMGKSGSRYVGSREEYKQAFSSMLQLLLYLCSEEPDMPDIEHPRERRTYCGGVRGPSETRVWDVGIRISHAIRNAGERGWGGTVEGTTHASPRPHVRSAHWHTYWTGPRKERFPVRKPVLRWIPPIPIGMDWKKELPTHIRVLNNRQ